MAQTESHISTPPSSSTKPNRSENQRFEHYLEAFQNRIYTYVLRLCKNQHLAEDITQETFIKLYKELSRIREETVCSWLYRVARNLFIDSRRKKNPLLFTLLQGQNRNKEEVALDFTRSERTPYEESSKKELHEQLHKAMNRMSKKYREPVILCDLENLTYEEAAQVLGCSIKTVSARLHRGRAFLANCLDRFIR